MVENCPVEIRPLFENPGNLKPGKNKPGRIIKFTQIWILEEELDYDEDVHVDLVVPSSIKWLSLLVTKCTVFDDVIFPTS